MSLWSIYIPGPDEYHAAPSETAAKHMASRHNAAMDEWYASHSHKNKSSIHMPIECTKADVIEWPFDAEDHAEEIREFDFASWGLEGGAV